MSKKIKGIFDRTDVDSVIHELTNAQDKFIVMALFNGISGEDVCELRGLKVSDIDFKNNKIILPNREIHMDAEFAEITKEAILQKTYITRISDSVHASEDFEFNMDSEYVIKSKPTSRNNFGCNEMAYEAFRTRIRILGLPFTPKDLIDSGLINKMLEMQPKYTVAEVEKTLAELGIKKSAYRIYNIINQLSKDNF